MNHNLIQIQIFYEIAMSIGNSLDLNQMLKASLISYLRKLSCSAGMVLQMVSSDKNTLKFFPRLSIPRNAQITCKTAMDQIPGQLNISGLNEFVSRLPIIGKMENKQHFYIMDMPGFGLLLLVKSGESFDSPMLRSMHSLNRKLAESSMYCLQSKKIEEMNRQLKDEIIVRRSVEKRLEELLEKLELRVDERTRELNNANVKLKMALENVKQLSGLLPICANCKKIRDDKGYWKQIETYICEHSEAQFSHGLCPECVDKFYPPVE